MELQHSHYLLLSQHKGMQKCIFWTHVRRTTSMENAVVGPTICILNKYSLAR